MRFPLIPVCESLEVLLERSSVFASTPVREHFHYELTRGSTAVHRRTGCCVWNQDAVVLHRPLLHSHSSRQHCLLAGTPHYDGTCWLAAGATEGSNAICDPSFRGLRSATRPADGTHEKAGCGTLLFLWVEEVDLVPVPINDAVNPSPCSWFWFRQFDMRRFSP